MQRVGKGKEITSLTKNKPPGQLHQIATGTEDQVTLLYLLDGAKLVPLFSVQIDRSIPACISFAENKEDILVFGLKDSMV